LGNVNEKIENYNNIFFIIIIMASLTKQMDDLKNQQAVLDEKMKVEQERKLKESYTLEKLEQLNKSQHVFIKSYRSKDGKYRGKFELQQTNLMTKPRFDIILEILKNQEERIKELETLLNNKT